MEENNGKKIIVAALGILIVGGVLFGSYLYSENGNNIFRKKQAILPVSNENFKKARQIFSIDPNMSKDLLEKALPEVSKGSDEEGYIKLYLGTAILSEEEDRAISLLKEVSLNESYLPTTRSSAVNNLALYFDSKRNEVLANKIFSGDKWSDFYDINEKDKYVALYNAELKAFEWSVEISPNYLAGYKVASMYGYILFVSKNSERKVIYASNVKKYIEIGDDSLRATIKLRDDSENYVSQVVNGLLHKAGALEQLYVYSKDKDLLSQIEDSFQSANAYLNSNAEVYQAKKLFGKYYFNYASFLLRQIKPTPNAEISSLLALLIKDSSDPVVKSIVKAKDDSDLSFFKNEIIDLAKVDKDFKKFLLNSGWKESDFASK